METRYCQTWYCGVDKLKGLYAAKMVVFWAIHLIGFRSSDWSDWQKPLSQKYFATLVFIRWYTWSQFSCACLRRFFHLWKKMSSLVFYHPHAPHTGIHNYQWLAKKKGFPVLIPSLHAGFVTAGDLIMTKYRTFRLTWNEREFIRGNNWLK